MGGELPSLPFTRVPSSPLSCTNHSTHTNTPKNKKKVDPGLRRTVVVASKFDNRLKEFNERHEVDRYLAADGYLPPGVKPFFVALPKERGAAASAGGTAEFRRQLGEVDAGVLAALREGVKGGFDEARFGARVGFANLKRCVFLLVAFVC